MLDLLFRSRLLISLTDSWTFIYIYTHFWCECTMSTDAIFSLCTHNQCDHDAIFMIQKSQESKNIQIYLRRAFESDSHSTHTHTHAREWSAVVELGSRLQSINMESLGDNSFSHQFGFRLSSDHAIREWTRVGECALLCARQLVPIDLLCLFSATYCTISTTKTKHTHTMCFRSHQL